MKPKEIKKWIKAMDRADTLYLKADAIYSEVREMMVKAEEQIEKTGE